MSSRCRCGRYVSGLVWDPIQGHKHAKQGGEWQCNIQGDKHTRHNDIIQKAGFHSGFVLPLSYVAVPEQNVPQLDQDQGQGGGPQQRQEQAEDDTEQRSQAPAAGAENCGKEDDDEGGDRGCSELCFTLVSALLRHPS